MKKKECSMLCSVTFIVLNSKQDPNLNFPVNEVPFENLADNYVSVKFKNRGNITAFRVSVTA